MTQKSYQLFPNVKMGKNVTIQDWAVIGLPPPGAQPGELETVIEDNSVIRSHSVIYAGSKIGAKFQTGHRIVLGPGMEIGDGCSVGTGTVALGFSQMEDTAKVHSYCTVGEFSQMQSGSWVGPRCLLDSRLDTPCVIASGAILGAKVYVAPGIRVGERVLIAASVNLYKDAAPYRLHAGNPTRGIINTMKLTCPYELIERPYEPDSPEVMAQVKETHRQHQPIDETPQGWRHDLWHQLGSRSLIA